MLNLRVLTLSGLFEPCLALEMYPDNICSIHAAQNTVLQGMLAYNPWVQNKSGSEPGMFQQPYYWWEASIAWSTILDWQTYTGNETYDRWIKDVIQLQSGEKWNFMSVNHTSDEGNDDQAFWGILAMNAAEKNFTPPDKGYPPWLYFAQATFNTMSSRWDNSTCGGGLRWQIFPWNAGYDYKNMVSNGCLLHLAARLARFTNNQSYVDWAEKVWAWATDIGFLNPINSPNATDPSDVYLQVFDGAHLDTGCTDIAKAEWTYDQGLLISAAAYLYNHTGDTRWRDRVKSLWSRAEIMFGSDGSSFFAKKSILYEPSCMTADESVMTCTTDQRCFKGIMLQMLGQTLQVMPSMYEDMWTKIHTSAQAAAWSCSGGYDGTTCGLSWLNQGWDGRFGLGEQICAFSALNTLLYRNFSGPYKASDLPEIYGSSRSFSQNSSSSNQSSSDNGDDDIYGFGNVAGLNSSHTATEELNLGKGDVAGASILTAAVVLILLAGSCWLLI